MNLLQLSKGNVFVYNFKNANNHKECNLDFFVVFNVEYINYKP